MERAVIAKTFEEIFGHRKAEATKKRREIPIDFPFYGEQKEHRLVLAAPEDGQNAYELLYYDGDGKIADQPAYVLEIDQNMGMAIPKMIRCL